MTAWRARRTAATTAATSARWLTGGDVERILRNDLTSEKIRVSLDTSIERQARLAVAAHGHYVAVIDDDGIFQSLLDRYQISDMVALSCLPAADNYAHSSGAAE